MADKWLKVGSILKGDKGKYIKMNADVTLTKGQSLQIFDPRKSKFAEEHAPVPDFVVADIFLAPDKKKAQTSAD